MTAPLNRFYEFGDFRLDSLKRILQKNGENVPLKGKAFDLLLFLVKSDGEILTHEQLLESVWEGTYVEQANLKKNISTLRKVLDENPEESNYIQTLPKKGYRFIADVYIPDVENPTSVDSGDSDYSALQLIDVSAESNKLLHQTPFESSESPDKPSAYRPSPQFPYKLVFQILVPVLVISVGVSAFLIWKSWQKSLYDNLKLENVKLQKLPSNANVVTSGISPDGKIVVFATLEEGDKQALWMRRIGTPNAIQIVPPAQMNYRVVVLSPDNNFAYYGVTIGNTEDYLYKIPVFGGAPRKIIDGIHSPVSFSPDGKKIAFVRDDNKGRTLFTANAVDGGDEREVFTTPDAHNLINPRFSPSGDSFGFIMGQATPNGRLWMLAEMPAIGGKINYITQPQKNKIFDFAWLVDGSGFIICGEPPDAKQTQIYRVKYPSGEISKLTNDFLNYEEVSVSADGKNVLVLQEERVGNLWAADAANPGNPQRLDGIQNPFGRFAVLPDEQILYVLSNSGERSLLVADTNGNNSRNFTSETNLEHDPAVSPDGKSIVFISKQSGTDEVWQSDLNGGNLHQLTNERTFIATPQISPDGKSLYFQRFDDTAWHLIRLSLENKQTAQALDESVSDFDFSPDGNYLAYNFYDEAKKKWNVAVRRLSDNSLLKVFDVSSSSFLRWTPDSKGLIYSISDMWREGGNVWLQPIDGSPAKLYLDAKPQKIYIADFSNDGKKLFYMRGVVTSSLVMIKTE